MEAWEPIKIAQDTRKHGASGRLRVGITGIIQHAGVARCNRTEQNTTKLNRTEQYI